MLGKKLYSLISGLDTSERKLLFNSSHRSEDKRFQQIAVLLGKKNQSIQDFQLSLDKVKEQVAPKGSSAKVKSDSLRRFVDFACKEIENMKISVFTKENSKIRNYILSEIYKSEDTRELQEDYLDKLDKLIDDHQDFWLRDYYLVQESTLKLRSQTNKDMEEWRDLAVRHKKLIHSFYLKKTSTIYDKISASYLDDKNSIARFGSDLTDENYIKNLALQSDDLSVRAVFYLSLAQFNFENLGKFDEYSELTLSCLEGTKDRGSEFIRRKMLFVNFLHAFHFGYSSEKILSPIEGVMEIDLRYKQTDQPAVFLFFLTQLVFNEKGGKLNYFKSDPKKYFNLKSTDYFYKFLQAFEYFKKNELKAAKSVLVNISYSKNPYVASWSRLLEIVINLKQGNEDLVHSYLVSEIRKTTANISRTFTVNSSVALLMSIAKKLDIRIPISLQKFSVGTKTVSPFHAHLLDYIKNL